MGVHMFMCSEELAWATGKQHWVISIVINTYVTGPVRIYHLSTKMDNFVSFCSIITL